MFAGAYFAGAWYAGIAAKLFLPWFALDSNKPVGWRIQQV
jgi:hypothetical protein